jgi:purine-nucleoside/S-methyl-5'-thioadenosine phosphorylase / adenosine deaminase
VPVVLATEGAVAAIHAGWRGLADGVLEEGVAALRELKGGAAATMTAVIGPCAGACCYEVGGEVLRRFEGELRRRSPRRDASGRARLDLRALAERRLTIAGVARVEHLELCTICDERLFSHRRERGAAGRQAAIAWLP